MPRKTAAEWRTVAHQLAEAIRAGHHPDDSCLWSECPAVIALERHAELAKPRPKPVAPGKPAYGWKLEGSQRVPDPAEQHIIREARRLLKAGWTPGRVCDSLNREGIPGPAGGRWHRTSLRRVCGL